MKLASFGAVVLITTALLLKPLSSYALDYAPLTLSRMILIADSIDLVKVLESSDDFYRIQPAVTLKGYVFENPLDVYEYTQWKTGKSLASADEVIMFLQRSQKKQWYVMGADGEGFVPVVDGQVYLHGVKIDRLEMKEYKLHGQKLQAVRADKNDLLELIEDFMQCFRNQEKGKMAVMRICSDEKLNELRNRSELHRSVFYEVMNLIQ